MKSENTFFRLQLAYIIDRVHSDLAEETLEQPSRTMVSQSMAPADDDLADLPSRMFALVKPLIAVLCSLGGFFGIFAGLSSSDLSVVESAAAETAVVYQHVDDQTASMQSELVTSGLVTVPIQDIHPGMRVLADNPLEETFANPVDPDTWRQLELQLEKPSGDVMNITLLRPVDQYPDIAVGQFIELDLEEMGVSGPALLQAIKRCPPLADGEGQIVTGKFEHPSADVIDVLIEGEPEPLGTTASHPFFSQDRNAFIPAGELLVGERLQTEDGRTVRVQQITQRSSKHTVFNIEVNVEHVYHVGKNGILVHNTYGRKRINVGPSGHHVPAVRKSRGRPFEVGRGDKTRPTIFSLGDDVGHDHWRLHNAERGTIGPRQGDFAGTDDELFDAYRQAYEDLDDIRVDVRSPNGTHVLGEDISPREAIDLIEDWLRQQGLR